MTKEKLGRGVRISITAIALAVLLLMVTSLSVGVSAKGMEPDGPTEKYIYGYVKHHDNGTVISGATVYCPELGSKTTDANGRYAYIDVSYGTYVIQAMYTGHWTEKANVTITYPQIIKRQDFYLPDDLAYEWQPLIVLYSTVDDEKSQTDLDFEVTSGAEAVIYDYAAGSGYDYTATLNEYQTGHEDYKSSLVLKKRIRVTGWFWATQSGECMNCYGAQQYAEYDQSNTNVDSLNPSSVQKTPVNLSPDSTHGIGVTQTGSCTLQLGVCISISVGILGTSFGTAFESGISVTDTSNIDVSITFKNIDAQTRTFYYYIEGNIVLHLWDEDNI